MSTGDALGPKPPKPEVKVVVNRREPIKGDSEENRFVKRAGMRLAPDGTEHVASFCVHVYRQPLSMSLAFVSQVLEDCGQHESMELRSYEANNAIQDLAIATAKRFGWQPDKKTTKTIIER